jgi:hypothetical protein
VLHIRASDARQDAYKSALEVGETITASTRAAIIRLKMYVLLTTFASGANDTRQEAKISVNPVVDQSSPLMPTSSGSLDDQIDNDATTAQ